MCITVNNYNCTIVKEINVGVTADTIKFMNTFAETYIQRLLFDNLNHRLKRIIHSNAISQRINDTTNQIQSTESKADSPAIIISNNHNNINQHTNDPVITTSSDNSSFRIPILHVKCIGWIVETDAEGNEYTAYQLNISNYNIDESYFCSRLMRFSEINAFHERLVNDLKSQHQHDIINVLKHLLPSKTFFWATMDDKTKNLRQIAINEYMKFVCREQTLCNNRKFLEFLGFQANYQLQRKKDMEIFHQALIATCEKENLPPLPFDLEKYGDSKVMKAEPKQLIYVLKRLLQHKRDANKIQMQTREQVYDSFVKICIKAMSDTIRKYWNGLVKTRSIVQDTIDDIIKNKAQEMDECINIADGLCRPIVASIKIDGNKDSDYNRKSYDNNESDRKSDHESTGNKSIYEYDNDGYAIDLDRIDIMLRLKNDMLSCINSNLSTGPLWNRFHNFCQQHFDTLFNDGVTKAQNFDYRLREILEYIQINQFGRIETYHQQTCVAIFFMFKYCYMSIKQIIKLYLGVIDKQSYSNDIDESKNECNYNYEYNLEKMVRDCSAIIFASSDQFCKDLSLLTNTISQSVCGIMMQLHKRVSSSIGNFVSQLTVDFGKYLDEKTLKRNNKDLPLHFFSCLWTNLKKFVNVVIPRILNGLFDATQTDVSNIILKNLQSLIVNVSKNTKSRLDFLPSVNPKYLSFSTIARSVAQIYVEQMAVHKLRRIGIKMETKLFSKIQNQKMVHKYNDQHRTFDALELGAPGDIVNSPKYDQRIKILPAFTIVDRIDEIDAKLCQMEQVARKNNLGNGSTELQLAFVDNFSLIKNDLKQLRRACKEMKTKNESIMRGPQQKNVQEKDENSDKINEEHRIYSKNELSFDQQISKLKAKIVKVKGSSGKDFTLNNDTLNCLIQMKQLENNIQTQKEKMIHETIAYFDSIQNDLHDCCKDFKPKNIIDSFEKRWMHWDIGDAINWFNFVLKHKKYELPLFDVSGNYSDEHESANDKGDYDQDYEIENYSSESDSGNNPVDKLEESSQNISKDMIRSGYDYDLYDNAFDFGTVKAQLEAMQFRANQDLPIIVKSFQFSRFGFKNKQDCKILCKQTKLLMKKYPKETNRNRKNNTVSINRDQENQVDAVMEGFICDTSK